MLSFDYAYKQLFERGRIRKLICLALLLSGLNHSFVLKGETEVERLKIERLVREMLKWSEGKNSITVFKGVEKDSVYIGLDMDEHALNLNKLEEGGFFADEFIADYDSIIRLIDRNLRNGKYAPWYIGEFPPFEFSADANIWCNCQDFPYDSPHPYDHVEVVLQSLDAEKASGYWKWGGLNNSYSAGWRNFKYGFGVVKEAGAWKISRLQNFVFTPDA